MWLVLGVLSLIVIDLMLHNDSKRWLKEVGIKLIIVGFVLFGLGILLFSMHISDYTADDMNHLIMDGLDLTLQAWKNFYRIKFIVDGSVVLFGAISLIVGGVLTKKQTHSRDVVL